MTEEEFVAKIINEGGIMAALQAGLRADTLLITNSHAAALYGAWKYLQSEYARLFVEAVGAVEQLIPEEAW